MHFSNQPQSNSASNSNNALKVEDQHFVLQAEQILNPLPVLPTLRDNDNNNIIDETKKNISEGDSVPNKKRVRH